MKQILSPSSNCEAVQDFQILKKTEMKCRGWTGLNMVKNWNALETYLLNEIEFPLK